METTPIPCFREGSKLDVSHSVKILSDRRPYMVAVYDGGGLEVAGHIVSPWWRNLGAWARLLVNRNTHGLLPFDHSPEPWPGFYWGILEAERSHLEVSWPLDCDKTPRVFKVIPPRDWQRKLILKLGGNPCK
jgi:hypothetical protein